MHKIRSPCAFGGSFYEKGEFFPLRCRRLKKSEVIGATDRIGGRNLTWQFFWLPFRD